MFKKVKPYMGKYIKYTYGALAVMFIALIASAVPFFLVYRIIKPLLEGEKLSADGSLQRYSAMRGTCDASCWNAVGHQR